MREMSFVHNGLDRMANARGDAGAVTAFLQADNTRFVHVCGDRILMDGEALFTLRPDDTTNAVLLGVDDDKVPWFAVPTPDNNALVPLRQIMMVGGLEAAVVSLLAQARSLIGWHERHGFCANCGVKTAMADAGYKRVCPSCAVEHFPRTDPVVIMAVRHDNRLLLGRQAAWPPGMYSTLAGFMEPGETLEQAVAREVHEETGVKLGAVRYVASQPWPFPSSLMVGMIAQATTTALHIDPQELETARWFAFDEVRLMLDNAHPEGLSASHPFAIAHHLIKAALTD